MSLSVLKKQYLIAVVIILVLVAINVAGFWVFLRPGVPNTFGGKVAELSDQTLSVVDAHGRSQLFTLASSTKIVFGKNVSSSTDLLPGVFVMVTAVSREPSATATKIRILSTDPFNRPRKPATP